MGERIRFVFFGEIGGSKAIVLGTRVRDIRSPNQYKSFEHHEAKRSVMNHESSNRLEENT